MSGLVEGLRTCGLAVVGTVVAGTLTGVPAAAAGAAQASAGPSAASATSVRVGVAVPVLVRTAEGLPGSCRTSAGTTVVVDFTAFGGSIVVRCVEPAPSDGADALMAAGFKPEGTQQYGLAFICRLSGRPAANETLAVDGDRDGYQEQCQQTPPKNAYWGYWQASNGGSWQFSNEGAASSDPIAGGFEGWSFQLNRAGKSPIPPKVTPLRRGPTDNDDSGTGGSGSGGSGSGGSGSGSGGSGSGGSGSGGSGAGGSGSGSGSSGSASDGSGSGSGSGGSGGSASGTGGTGSGSGSSSTSGSGSVGTPGGSTGAPPNGGGADVDGSSGGSSGPDAAGTTGTGSTPPSAGTPSADPTPDPLESKPDARPGKPGQGPADDRTGNRRGEWSERSRGDRRDKRPAATAPTPTPSDALDDDVVITSELPPQPAIDDGSPLATALGVGLLALLGAGAGVTAWRRRRA